MTDITKCAKCDKKLLQSVTGITKRDNYYKDVTGGIFEQTWCITSVSSQSLLHFLCFLNDFCKGVELLPGKLGMAVLI